MRNTWQLQEAKSKLSELVDRALRNGPQQITRHGKKAVVVISTAEYERLTKKKGSLAAFFHKAPLRDLEFERSKDTSRSIKL